MDAEVTHVALGPGSSEHLEQAWELTAAIREELGIFNYSRAFFSELYTRSHVYAAVAPSGDALLGCSIVRDRGYLSVLAVRARERGQGIGRRLIEATAEDFDVIECHVRESNTGAIEFYRDVGFELLEHEPNHYDNGDDALRFQYGP